MKILFLTLMVMFYVSGSAVDSNSNGRFTLRTEEVIYNLNNTTCILTTFNNNLGVEVIIINSSCGGPHIIIEKYDEKNWGLYSEHPICEKLPEEPINLADGKMTERKINISLMTNPDEGLFRMKFQIQDISNNLLIDD